MNDIRGNVELDQAHVRAEFVKHIEKITMEPSGEHYAASGTWYLVGRGSSDGAGGPDRTVRFFEFCLPMSA
jgi:hypothetical protein